LVVRLLSGGLESDRVKTRSAVFGGKTIEKEARSAGMVHGGTGPEDAIGSANTVPGDAGIVGDPASGGAAQFLENFGGLRRERGRGVEARGESGDDFDVGAHAFGRLHGT